MPKVLMGRKWLTIVEQYKYSYFIIWGIILPVVMLLFDNEPPSFPLADNIEAIDCNNIELIKGFTESSRIRFFFRKRKFLEYPDEVAHDLIRIETQTANNSLNYYSQSFWDLKQTESEFEFAVLHTIQGRVKTSVLCHQRTLGVFDFNIPEISIFPVGWSLMLQNGAVEFKQFCFHDGNIVFGSKERGKINGFNLSRFLDFKIEFDQRPMKLFQESGINTTLTEKPVVFVTDIGIESVEEYFVDVVIPALLSGRNAVVYVLRVINQTSNFTGLERLGKEVVFHDVNKRSCFKSGLFAKSRWSTTPFQGTESEDFMLWMINEVQNYIPELRSRFVTNHKLGEHVVCDQRAKLAIGHCEELPVTNSVQDIANIVAGATEFIVSDESTASFALFLTKNTTLSTTNRKLRPLLAKMGTFMQITTKYYEL